MTDATAVALPKQDTIAAEASGWQWHVDFQRARRSPPRKQSLGAHALNTDGFVREVLDEVLSLSGRALGLPAGQPLRDALPDLDSMAVVSVIALFEERLDIMVEPGELTGDVFETIATLVNFVDAKLQDRA